jgi:uncharacterized membrane protein
MKHTRVEGNDPMAFIDKSIEVRADVRDVYAAWAAFEDYPRFMEVIERVTVMPEDRLHWVAVIDEEIVEWDALVVEHIPEERIAWRAVDGRESGQVRFEKRAADRTVVHYQLMYDPEMWGANSDELMEARAESDLQAFKQAIEAGQSWKAA